LVGGQVARGARAVTRARAPAGPDAPVDVADGAEAAAGAGGACTARSTGLHVEAGAADPVRTAAAVALRAGTTARSTQVRRRVAGAAQGAIERGGAAAVAVDAGLSGAGAGAARAGARAAAGGRLRPCRAQARRAATAVAVAEAPIGSAGGAARVAGEVARGAGRAVGGARAPGISACVGRACVGGARISHAGVEARVGHTRVEGGAGIGVGRSRVVARMEVEERGVEVTGAQQQTQTQRDALQGSTPCTETNRPWSLG
jgi:hypothetical protein